MKIIDKTIDFPTFLCNGEINWQIASYASYLNGDSYCLISEIEKIIPKKFLCFKYNNYISKGIFEIINGLKVRIPNKNWDRYILIIQDRIIEYEKLTNENILIEKVISFTYQIN